MTKLLQPIRFFAVLFCIFVYLAHMSLVWMMYRNRWKRVRRANELLTSWVRLGLWLLNVRVNVLGEENLTQVRSALYVGNHLSYLDVLVIASRIPVCFVTSMEVKRAPLLGQIVTMAGCLFVDRKTRANLRSEVKDITDALAAGLNVAIFPEATSTNGEQILRFKRPLYMAPIASGRPVVPFCLNYHSVGGAPINQVSRDKVFYYGDMNFGPHLWEMAGAGGIVVDLHFLKPMLPEISDGPSELAEKSRASIEQVFKPVTATIAQKEEGLH